LMRCAGNFDSCPIKKQPVQNIPLSMSIHGEPLGLKMLHGRSIVTVLSDWIEVLSSWA